MKKLIAIALLLTIALPTQAHAKKLEEITRKDLCKPFCWVIDAAVSVFQAPFKLLEKVKKEEKPLANLGDITSGN